jgi:large subunit ribosomal protein L5
MNFFETYYKRIIKQDLTNKFTFHNNKSITKLKKITLNFGCKNFSIQKFATTMLALEMIALKKSALTTAKNPNVLLKIQKGQPAGCKIELKNKEIYPFLTKLNLEILPKLKNFPGFRIERQFSNFFFQIQSNKIMIKEFESQYPLFANLPALDINVTTNSKNYKKILFLAKSVKLPFFIRKT